jgi:RHS repeat-associated protein
MTQRTVNQQTYNFGYDAENHLTVVSGAAQAQFTYNGDGQRVVATEGITTTVFVGNYFEWQIAADGVVTTTESTKYYFAGGVRLAMQRGVDGVKFILGDHLGSASVVLNADGTQRGVQGYYPWGEINFTEGTIDTEYTFTGQYSYRASFGLMYYRARWYSTELGRFAQPDTVIPDQYNPLDWDRYSYVRNNPVRYMDPSGHKSCEDEYSISECNQYKDPYANFWNQRSEGQKGDNDLMWLLFGVELSPEQVKALLQELDLAIAILEGLADAALIMGALGFFIDFLIASEVSATMGLGFAAALTTPTLAGLGLAAGALLLGGYTASTTSGDLLKLQKAVILGSNTTWDARTGDYLVRNGIKLSMSSNFIRWQISVNGRPAVSRLNLHPLLTPSGTWNATPYLLLLWYLANF